MRGFSRIFLLFVLTASFATSASAQYTAAEDSLKQTANVIGGIYDRPYIYQLGGNIAIGGYAEMNSNFQREQGLEEGLSFEARRFNLFTYSAISDRIKFTSEVERTERVKHDRCFLIGDSAGFASRDLGEGIGQAIESGFMAADEIMGAGTYAAGQIATTSIGIRPVDNFLMNRILCQT